MSDDDLIRREAEELIAFLRGAAPLHGCWFGERYDDRPAFWWRNELGRLERAIPATDAREAALREAALDRMKAASAALPEGPWEVWNSCSFRRITGPDGRDGGILCGVVQRSDNHPDLSMPEAQLRALCDLVNAARALIGEERT